MNNSERKQSRVRLFPTLIYDVECLELIDEVVDEFNKCKWVDEWVNVNDNCFTLDSNKNLTKKFEDIVNETLSEIQYTVPLKISTSWFTRTKDGAMGKNHIHVNSFWSGIFYFQDNNSNLVVVKDPPQIHVPWKTKDIGLVTSGDVALKADKGHMILIPGNLRHYIQQNIKGEDRNSLAINFMPNGLCFVEDSSYNYK